jgi:flagellar M-ring protein FliF
MALVKAETAEGFWQMPGVRQLAFMVAMASSIALGVVVVMWMSEPNFALLYGNLSDKDAGQVVEALQKAGIGYKVEEGTGAVMVPSTQLHQARLELANQGLPEASGMGFEILQQDQGFGTSQFIETARFQRALEGELSRTISTMRNVQSARVHLAVPKRSVFVRNRSNPSASVMVHLFSGRSLDEEQVAAVVHLVSSSVPHLEPEAVTVIDHRGNLLTHRRSPDEVTPSPTQFSYTRKLEESYVKRIEDLLTPMVGVGGLRAQVTADLDFTVTERTQETYNPDLPSLRSEYVEEETRRGGALGAQGVPGALTNQPPGGGVAPELAGGEGGAGAPGLQDATAAPAPTNSSRSTTRNYELDKTISHTRLATGRIRRLSVAVVLDDKRVAADGAREPWTDAELQRFTALVREAVGFDAARGDRVNVINASFQQPPEPEPLPEPSMLEQPWIWDVAKQIAGALGLLILAFGVLKPALKGLAERGAQEEAAQQAAQQAALAAAGAEGGAGSAGPEGRALPKPGQEAPRLQGPADQYEEHLTVAQTVVQEDAKRVAQVVKNWVGDDG